MRSIVTQLVFAVLVGCFIVMWSAHNNGSVVAAQQRKPLAMTRMYTGPDGQTHAEEIDAKLIPLGVGRGGVEQSEIAKATSVWFVRRPPGWTQDWHPAPERRYGITLSGRGEVEVAGGHKIRLEPGSTLLIEDLTGKGHITRTLGTEDWTAELISLVGK